MSMPVICDKIFMYIVMLRATFKKIIQSDMFEILQLVKIKS